MNCKSLKDVLEDFDNNTPYWKLNNPDGSVDVILDLYYELKISIHSATWLREQAEIEKLCETYDIYQVKRALYLQLMGIATYMVEHSDVDLDYSDKIEELLLMLGMTQKLNLFGRVLRDIAESVAYQLKYGRIKSAGVEVPEETGAIVLPIFKEWYDDHTRSAEEYSDERSTAYFAYEDDPTLKTLSAWICAKTKCSIRRDPTYRPILEVEEEEPKEEEPKEAKEQTNA